MSERPIGDIEHEFTEEIVCPFCGHAHCDSWEYGDGEDDGLESCLKCGGKFTWSRNSIITYSTERAGV